MISANVSGGSITLDEDGLVLTWGGIASSRAQRRSSPRRIPFGEIRAIQAHEPGRFSNGWVRFGREMLGKVGAQPPNDLYSIAFARADEDYSVLLKIVGVASRKAALPNPLPEPSTPSGLAGYGPVPPISPKGKWANMRPDIASAATRMKWTLGGGREIRKLESHLRDEEHVEELAQGTYSQNQGIVALTNQRLLFLFQGFVSQRTEEFSLDSITAVEISKRLNTGTLRLRMSGNTCEISNVIVQDLDRMATAVRDRIQHSAPHASPSPGMVEDPITLIRRLGELREAGLLSDAEYETKKQELLRRL